MNMPDLFRVEQRFPGEKITDIESVIKSEMAQSAVEFAPGSRIAIAVGSRGIANIQLIVRSVVNELKAKSVLPFIVPAMGSHGGATAAGQEEVLASYGITEAETGAPVRSSMDVVQLPQGLLTHNIYQDKLANGADGIILINRVKVHTDYQGNIESGLMKMCVIGLGKHQQALTMHRYGVPGLRDLIPPAAKQIIKTSKIMLGLGIVENAYDQTMKIKAVQPERFEEDEAQLLELCRKNMPGLPLAELDLLIVDQMGKEISGTGMDPNIIGRRLIQGEPEPANGPRIKKIIVSDLSRDTHGNALGMGLADFITRRLQDKIDFAATYENILTSTFTERGKMPIVAATDQQAFSYAVRTWGMVDPAEAAIIRIQDTLHLDRFYASAKVIKQIADLPAISVNEEPEQMLDQAGQLRPFWA